MTESSWRPKFIVLDTNVLVADIALSSTRADFLRTYCQRYGSVVVVPRVVRLEVDDHLRSDVQELAGALAGTAVKLERYGAAVPRGLTFTYNASLWIGNARQQLSRRLEWLRARDMELPDANHEEIVARLAGRSRPFGTKKDKEIGYRDFLLWRNVLSLNGPTALVTSDRLGFMEKDDLHPDLLRDVTRMGKDVRVFAGLGALTERLLRPSFPTIDTADLLLNRIDQRNKMETFASSGLDAGDVEDLLWASDLAALVEAHTDGRISPSQLEYISVLGIDGVRLEEHPTEVRALGDERVVALYDAVIDIGVAVAEYDNEEWEQIELLSETIRLEYTLDVSGAEIAPVAVSLSSQWHRS